MLTMKQIFAWATFATTLAAFLAGCAGETTGPSESGSVSVSLVVGGTDVTAVTFDIACESGLTLDGEFNVNDDQDPPIWALVMNLPAENCNITMVAFDGAGAPLCTGSQDFTVLVDESVKLDLVLVCAVDGEDPLGNIDVDAIFQIVPGNNCPRLHFLNAVPDDVPPEGSEVTVLVSDKDDDALTTALTATGGSFADPSAQSTTYACDSASGAQTISVTVSDGDTSCDKSKSFGVTCPGMNLCDGVVCPDDGNDCTAELCDPADGLCKPQNEPIDTGCDLGQGPDTGVCDGQGTCAECNIDAQCQSGEACVGNVCEPALEICYEQDFESLDSAGPDALANDGWLDFGNVFDSGGTFLFGYGAFGAPNGGPGFSGIVSGQGGPDQGAQQLSIYNDYNCCQPNNGHFNGTDLVEASVFQEIGTILAADIGRTFTFSFDAKRGDIQPPTTARAYIQTLDPAAGFNRTNLVEVDTTNLPTTWARYEISLDLTNPQLVGQILQFGFQSTASSFNASQNLYDNVLATKSGTGGGGPGIELRPLPEIYTTGSAINYGPYRGSGPGTGDVPSDADILEDLQLMQTAGFNLIRLFGGDAVSERILQLAEANFPEMRFQQGLFLEGLAGQAAQLCQSTINDSQVATAIQLANTYSNVVTVSVGNETSFFAPFMPLNCLEGYITEVRSNVTQPVTTDDDYTFYANFFGRSPDSILPLIDFAAIHMYPFTNYQQWDWQQLGVPAGPQRAEAMMNAALAKAQQNYQAVVNYRFREASGASVTIGESRPIVLTETGWKWRQTNFSQEIETYAANPVNAKWYHDLMRSWESSGGPLVMDFSAFDEAWKLTDDGWGFWDEARMPNYVLCDTPAGSPCNNPVYQGAGFFSP